MVVTRISPTPTMIYRMLRVLLGGFVLIDQVLRLIPVTTFWIWISFSIPFDVFQFTERLPSYWNENRVNFDFTYKEETDRSHRRRIRDKPLKFLRWTCIVDGKGNRRIQGTWFTNIFSRVNRYNLSTLSTFCLEVYFDQSRVWWGVFICTRKHPFSGSI